MLRKQIGWDFDNTYSKLSKNLLSKINPIPVRKPKLIIFNDLLADELGLNFTNIASSEIANIFSGNQLPEGSETIAQAYAGHQFGHFTILGDGRALMIGEHVTKNKQRFDIQFKGSGKTPYSRNADGRAALGPMLREYLISEAMHALKIKTTRSLAVVETGENVEREKILKGAILTRVASSHIRVGTFQYALISEKKDDLKNLFEYTINRHFPNLKDSKNQAINFLRHVQNKQIELVCDWMRVGFVHGVMNTDNMAISGETIDYGPCAFMDRYDPNTVFSSIDLNGRYAYSNQPAITLWNLERLAECLIPIIHNDRKKSIEMAKEVLRDFPTKYKKTWLKMMRSKLGIFDEDPKDESIIIELLTWMHKYKVDYTNTFCHLMDKFDGQNQIYKDEEFISWKEKWALRKKIKKVNPQLSLDLMKKTNPLVVPRNEQVEKALKDACEENNMVKFNELNKILSEPYKGSSLLKKYQLPASDTNKKYVTFCGT